MQIDVNVLMNYTDWEREKWREWLGQHSESLKTSVGPHGDNRFQTVGDVVKHIFSAETRYVERLSEKPLTDTASIPNDNLEALFGSVNKAARYWPNSSEHFPTTSGTY